jgi:hypothetical protein
VGQLGYEPGVRAGLEHLHPVAHHLRGRRDPVAVAELREVDLLLLGQRVLLRHRDERGFADELAELDAGEVARGHAVEELEQRHVHPALLQQVDDLRRRLPHLRPHVGVELPQPLDERREVEDRDAAQVQRAAPVRLSRGGHQLSHLVQHESGRAQYATAQVRWDATVARSVEQLSADQSLDCAQLGGQSGLGQSEPRGGPGHAAFLGDGANRAEVAELQLGHKDLVSPF